MQRDLNELANECCEAIKVILLKQTTAECCKAIKTILLKETTAQYDEDLLTPFLEERCVESINGRIRASILYNAYTLWCNQQECKEMSGKKFGLEIKKRFDSYHSNGVYYLGLKLNEN